MYSEIVISGQDGVYHAGIYEPGYETHTGETAADALRSLADALELDPP
jgi:predicted RNase H-like HicB family nuclease